MTDTSKIDARAEELVLVMRDRGVFEIDPTAGEIWRLGSIHRGDFKACARRRAEHPRDGYLRIRVMICSVRVQVTAHRVIYLAAHGSIPLGCVIDHVNERRDDNRVENLCAVTQSENVRRYYSKRWHLA